MDVVLVWTEQNRKECEVFGRRCLVAWRAMVSSIVDMWMMAPHFPGSEVALLSKKRARGNASAIAAFTRTNAR